MPRDEVARAINTEIKEGRGSPHGGVYLDIPGLPPGAVQAERAQQGVGLPPPGSSGQ
ncbi:MAG TPA: hypothetical protein VE623_02740 [Acidimicrobiales bacterium]|nr:hypothetical protein [Acidimicrobiales bacterium]